MFFVSSPTNHSTFTFTLSTCANYCCTTIHKLSKTYNP